MRPASRRPYVADRGFTLLELVNMLALTATLGALGMYGLARYIRHAKTAEAVGSVIAISEGAAAFYNGSDSTQPAGTKPEAARAMRHFPPSSKASVPADPLDVRGKRYQSTRADWSTSPWQELHFSIPQPQCYAYSFDANGSGGSAHATATAHGDLNADGSVSTFRLSVVPDSSMTAVPSRNVERVNSEE